MTREYHIHTRISESAEQALVFAVSRDTNHKLMQLHEIYVVTMVDGIETKMVINLDDIMPKIAQMPGGNVPKEHLTQMGKILENVLTQETKVDLINNEIDVIIENKETERMIIASEAALSAHPTNLSIDEIVNGKLSNDRS